MKFCCTKGAVLGLLALLVVFAAACTQSKPQVPTPTLVPLENDIILTQETPLAPAAVETAPAVGETPLAPGSETPSADTSGGIITPIPFEPTLQPTPTVEGLAPQPESGATPVPGAQGAPSGGTCPSPYTVQAGEWFLAIARKCGVSPDALAAANPGINPSLLRPGQKLNIPGGGSSGGAAPQPTSPSGGQQPSTGACTSPYIVQRGDTLYSIAQRCGSSVDAIMAANNIPAPEYIFPGQQLTIP